MDEADRLARWVERVSGRLPLWQAALAYLFVLPPVVLAFLFARACENTRLLCVRGLRVLASISGPSGQIADVSTPSSSLARPEAPDR
jgi:hypothetical protein